MLTLRTRTQFWMLTLCLVALVALVSPVEAQTPGSGKWEIEFHGGGVLPTNPRTGTVSLPGPGQAFTTAGIYPPPAPQVLVVSTSRRESSSAMGPFCSIRLPQL